jgi:23S rRNA (guanosine2251-2'-O)-methyltransferase
MALKGNQRRRGAAPTSGNPKFWGKHAVLAAIENPERRILKIWMTRDAMKSMELPEGLPIQFAEVTDLARFVPREAPHQGIVAEVAPLEDIWLADILEKGSDDNRPLLILDQVTDPHNVGAIFRSAAAFDAIAIVTQDRHAPAESGTLAKSASGALELVPWVRVVNLARTLDEISDFGYWRIALDGEAEVELSNALVPGRNALVLGAEGEGIRHNVKEHCDQIAKLPISAQMESLNVSNAAAIALYAAATRAA